MESDSASGLGSLSLAALRTEFYRSIKQTPEAWVAHQFIITDRKMETSPIWRLLRQKKTHIRCTLQLPIEVKT